MPFVGKYDPRTGTISREDAKDLYAAAKMWELRQKTATKEARLPYGSLIPKPPTADELLFMLPGSKLRRRHR